MLDFEAQFDLPDVDLALLMTYCASLAHVEQELLDYLIEGEGTSDVVLVMDEQQHNETFVEAAALLRAGLDYQVHPVRLPVSGPAFHPKLYVLCSRIRIRVVVASANLTLFGCRANAEVGAVLEIAPDETEEAQAFADLADFLERLPEVVDVGRAAQSIHRAAERIRRWLPDPLPAGRRRLLHSLDRPILEQLTELTGTAVRAVDVVTPYFDRDGRALREIQAAFRGAELTVTTSKHASGTLDGSVVAGWPMPPALQLLSGLAGKERTLHAKVLRVRTSHGVWSLLGSPNASAPGLLRSVRQGGNLEVALLVPDELASGMESADTRPGKWTDLQYSERTAPGAGAAPATSPLSILSAVLDGEHLTVDIAPPAAAADAWTVILELPGGDTPIAVEARAEGSRVHLTGAATAMNVPEEPVIVRAQAEAADGLREGRAWLSQTDLLRRTGWERRAHRMASRIEGGRSLSDTESQAFGDVLLQIVAEVCTPVYEPPPEQREGEGGDGEGGKRKIDREQRIAVKDLISHEGDGRHGQALATARRREALDRILRAFRANFLPLDEEDEPDDLEGLGGPKRGGPSKRRDTLKPATVRHLQRTFSESILAWSKAPVTPDRVGDMVRIIETVIRALLRYEIRLLRSGSTDHARELNDVLIEALRAAFSLDGFNTGDPAGWVIRAWAHPESREEVEAFLGPEGLGEDYLAHLGAAMARGVAAGTSRGEETWKLIRSGLDIVAGTNAVDLDALDRMAAKLVTGDEQLMQDSILRQLQTSEGEPALVAAARWWAPILAKGDGGGVPEDAPEALQRLQARQRDGLPLRTAPFRIAEQPYCGGCQLAVALSQVQHMGDPGQVTGCESCGAVLIPFDVAQPVCRAVLDRLVPALAGGS